MQQIHKNNFIQEKKENYFQEDQKNTQDKYFQDKSIIKVSDDISQITIQKNNNNDEKIQNLLDQNTHLLNKLQQLQKESQKLISQNLQNMKITLNDLISQNMQIKQESEDIQDQNQELMFQYENEKSQQEQNIRQEKSRILELKQKNAEFLIQVVQNYSQNLYQMKNSNLRDLISAIGKKNSVSKFNESFYKSEVPNNTLQNLIKNIKCSNFKQTMDSFQVSTNKQQKTNQFDYNSTRNKFLIQKQKSSSLMKFQKLNTIS